MAAAIATAGALLWGWLWDERFWLPTNVTWADLEGGEYPRPAHLLSSLPLALGIFALRRVFERYCGQRGGAAGQRAGGEEEEARPPAR